MRKPNENANTTRVSLDPKIKKAAMLFVKEEYGKGGSLSMYIEQLIRRDLKLNEKRMQEQVLERICDDWGEQFINDIRNDINKETNGDIYSYLQMTIIDAKSELMHARAFDAKWKSKRL